MTKDPWTDPDPQPGDFDAELATVDPRHVEVHEGNRDAKLTIVVSVEGENAKRLEQIATERGQSVDEVVAEQLIPSKPAGCRSRRCRRRTSR